MTTQTGQAVVSPERAPRKPRATRIGVVTSVARKKTIRVGFDYSVKHPKYGKYMRRRSVLHAHDENGEAAIGDVVEVSECRPISKTKHWRLLRIVRKAPTGTAGGEA